MLKATNPAQDHAALVTAATGAAVEEVGALGRFAADLQGSPGVATAEPAGDT